MSTSKSATPVLREVGLQAIRTHSAGYPSRGLTPESLSRIFMEADEGDITRQSNLFEEMEEKDAHLGAVLATRKLAVAGLEWDVLSSGQSAIEIEVATFIKDAINKIENFDEALLDLLDAIGKGFAVSELIWHLDSEGKALIQKITRLPQSCFTFRGRDTHLEAPQLLTNSEPLWGESLIADKYLLHRYRGRATATARAGVLRACAWAYIFKNYTLKDWLIFCERYAQPLRVGKYSAGTSEAERNVLKDAVFNMGVDAAAVISDSTVVELLDSGGKGSSAEIYEALVSYSDRAMSKAVLGQTMTTEHSGGSYAAARVHDSVRHDLKQADARALQKTLTRGLIAPLVRFNFGPTYPVPTLKFIHKPDGDLSELAQTYRTLADMGLEIPPAHLYERFGISAPTTKEAI